MARKNEHTNMHEVLQVMEPQESLRGKSFCITGHLGKPRAEIEALIVQAGGIVEKTVKFGLNYLITNEDWTANTVNDNVGSSKYQKAKKLRVKIISEAAFMEMITRRVED